MTGIVEMASIPSWKHGLPVVNGDLNDYHGIENNFSDSRRREQEMLDIPTWKREPVPQKSKNVLYEMKKTCVFDSSSITPKTDTKRNDLKSFSEPLDTEEKLNQVDPVKSEVSTKSLSSNSKMGTNTKTSNGRKVQFSKDTVSSVETSHLKRVHSNPFFEKLGVEHPHGNIYDSETSENDLTNGIATDDDNDINTEYAPNSGFVDKLRLKFSKLQSKPKNFKAPRRFASLESLVDVGKSKNEQKTSYEKSDNRQIVDNTKNLSDIVKNEVTKPKLRSAPKPPVHHRSRISSADDALKDSAIDSTNDHHISTDFIKGRDDIVIIEQEMQEPTSTVKKTKDINESGNIKVLKDGKVTADLPKPNTVINFRTMFEKRVSNTNILPDSYVKFRPNLPRGKLPPKPSVPPKRTSQELVGTVSKVEKDALSNDKIEQPVKHDTSKEIPKESSEPTPSQSVKDLSLIFKQKPDRPFESPKTKRRSPEKKAIFDSSVISQVKEDFIVKEEKSISPRSSVSEKPLIQRNKQEPINKQKASTQISTYKTEERAVSSSIAKLDNKEVKSSSESTLFPQRKQIFDSSNMTSTQTTSTPVAPPRVKGQKRNMSKKPTTPEISGNSSLKSMDKQLPSTNSVVEENRKNKNDEDNSESSFNNTNKMSVQEINERNKQKQLEAEKHLSKISVNDSKKVIDPTPNIPKENESNDSDTPTRGIPSIIAAKRLNKDNKLNLGKGIIPLTSASTDDSDEKPETLVKPSMFRSSRSTTPQNVPNNDDKNTDKFNFKNVLKSSKNSQVSGTNIEDLIKGNKKPSAVFDSSNIPVAPKRTASGVPPLNLSDLVDDKPLDHPYQEGYLPTKIEPCKIVFQGAGVKLKTTPLMKRRNVKGKISFHEDPKYHEYPSEDSALKHYLEENPHEVEDVKKEEEVISLGGSLHDESSDDVDEPTTPREDSAIKSNTPLSHSTGELTNYRSKYQTDEFTFGMSFSEPEPEVKVEEVESVDDEDMDLRPADESDTINYTDSSISDMLF